MKHKWHKEIKPLTQPEYEALHLEALKWNCSLPMFIHLLNKRFGIDDGLDWGQKRFYIDDGLNWEQDNETT